MSSGPLVLLSELRHALTHTLPDYMIPATFVVLDTMSLTPNGKVDRTALVQRALPRHIDDGFVAPSTLTQLQLAEIWGEVLGLERVGIRDNFFHIGGHSLLAVQLIAKAKRQFNLALPLSALFQSPTVSLLSQISRIHQIRVGLILSPTNY